MMLGVFLLCVILLLIVLLQQMWLIDGLNSLKHTVSEVKEDTLKTKNNQIVMVNILEEYGARTVHKIK